MSCVPSSNQTEISLSNQRANIIPDNGSDIKLKKLKQMIELLEKDKKEHLKTNQHLTQKTNFIYQQNKALKDFIKDKMAQYQQILDKYSRSTIMLQIAKENNKRMSKVYHGYKNRADIAQKINDDSVICNDEIEKFDQEIKDIQKSANKLLKKFHESEKKIYDYRIRLSLDSRLISINRHFTNEAKFFISKNPFFFSTSQLTKLQQKVDTGDEIKRELSLTNEESEKNEVAKYALKNFSEKLDSFVLIYNYIVLINKKRFLMNEDDLDDSFLSDENQSSKSKSIFEYENVESKVPKTFNLDSEISELKRIIRMGHFDYLSNRKIQSMFMPTLNPNFFDFAESTEIDSDDSKKENFKLHPFRGDANEPKSSGKVKTMCDSRDIDKMNLLENEDYLDDEETAFHALNIKFTEEKKGSDKVSDRSQKKKEESEQVERSRKNQTEQVNHTVRFVLDNSNDKKEKPKESEQTRDAEVQKDDQPKKLVHDKNDKQENSKIEQEGKLEQSKSSVNEPYKPYSRVFHSNRRHQDMFNKDYDKEDIINIDESEDTSEYILNFPEEEKRHDNPNKPLDKTKSDNSPTTNKSNQLKEITKTSKSSNAEKSPKPNRIQERKSFPKSQETTKSESEETSEHVLNLQEEGDQPEKVESANPLVKAPYLPPINLNKSRQQSFTKENQNEESEFTTDCILEELEEKTGNWNKSEFMELACNSEILLNSSRSKQKDLKLEKSEESQSEKAIVTVKFILDDIRTQGITDSERQEQQEESVKTPHSNLAKKNKKQTEIENVQQKIEESKQIIEKSGGIQSEKATANEKSVLDNDDKNKSSKSEQREIEPPKASLKEPYPQSVQQNKNRKQANIKNKPKNTDESGQAIERSSENQIEKVTTIVKSAIDKNVKQENSKIEQEGKLEQSKSSVNEPYKPYSRVFHSNRRHQDMSNKDYDKEDIINIDESEDTSEYILNFPEEEKRHDKPNKPISPPTSKFKSNPPNENTKTPRSSKSPNIEKTPVKKQLPKNRETKKSESEETSEHVLNFQEEDDQQDKTKDQTQEKLRSSQPEKISKSDLARLSIQKPNKNPQQSVNKNQQLAISESEDTSEHILALLDDKESQNNTSITTKLNLPNEEPLDSRKLNQPIKSENPRSSTKAPYSRLQHSNINKKQPSNKAQGSEYSSEFAFEDKGDSQSEKAIVTEKFILANIQTQEITESEEQEKLETPKVKISQSQLVEQNKNRKQTDVKINRPKTKESKSEQTRDAEVQKDDQPKKLVHDKNDKQENSKIEQEGKLEQSKSSVNEPYKPYSRVFHSNRRHQDMFNKDYDKEDIINIDESEDTSEYILNFPEEEKRHDKPNKPISPPTSTRKSNQPNENTKTPRSSKSPKSGSIQLPEGKKRPDNTYITGKLSLPEDQAKENIQSVLSVLIESPNSTNKEISSLLAHQSKNRHQSLTQMNQTNKEEEESFEHVLELPEEKKQSEKSNFSQKPNHSYDKAKPNSSQQEKVEPAKLDRKTAPSPSFHKDKKKDQAYRKCNTNIFETSEYKLELPEEENQEEQANTDKRLKQPNMKHTLELPTKQKQTEEANVNKKYILPDEQSPRKTKSKLQSEKPEQTQKTSSNKKSILPNDETRQNEISEYKLELPTENKPTEKTGENKKLNHPNDQTTKLKQPVKSTKPISLILFDSNKNRKHAQNEEEECEFVLGDLEELEKQENQLKENLKKEPIIDELTILDRSILPYKDEQAHVKTSSLLQPTKSKGNQMATKTKDETEYNAPEYRLIELEEQISRWNKSEYLEFASSSEKVFNSSRSSFDSKLKQTEKVEQQKSPDKTIEEPEYYASEYRLIELAEQIERWNKSEYMEFASSSEKVFNSSRSSIDMKLKQPEKVEQSKPSSPSFRTSLFPKEEQELDDASDFVRETTTTESASEKAIVTQKFYLCNLNKQQQQQQTQEEAIEPLNPAKSLKKQLAEIDYQPLSEDDEINPEFMLDEHDSDPEIEKVQAQKKAKKQVTFHPPKKNKKIEQKQQQQKKKKPFVSTYDRSIFYTDSVDLSTTRIRRTFGFKNPMMYKETPADQVPLTISLKDIGLEGFDSNNIETIRELQRIQLEQKNKSRILVHVDEFGERNHEKIEPITKPEVICKLSLYERKEKIVSPRKKVEQIEPCFTLFSLSDEQNNNESNLKPVSLLDSTQKAQKIQTIKPKMSPKNSSKATK